jgi:hypothetical protein
VLLRVIRVKLPTNLHLDRIKSSRRHLSLARAREEGVIRVIKVIRVIRFTLTE